MGKTIRHLPCMRDTSSCFVFRCEGLSSPSQGCWLEASPFMDPEAGTDCCPWEVCGREWMLNTSHFLIRLKHGGLVLRRKTLLHTSITRVSVLLLPCLSDLTFPQVLSSGGEGIIWLTTDIYQWTNLSDKILVFYLLFSKSGNWLPLFRYLDLNSV